MRSRPLPGAGTRLPQTTPAEALRRLVLLGGEALRAEWRRLHRAPPPACLSADLLRRGIAYRLQENTLGGLPAASRRQLTSLARGTGSARPQDPPPPPRLRPGTSLLREWHGRTHTVVVREDGFEHEGRRYTSLSHVARAITGAHWSGPRFFGLRRDTAAERRTPGEKAQPGA